MMYSARYVRGLGSIILTVVMVNISFAYTGDDPAYSPDYSCRIGQVTAQLGPDGSIKYNLTGNCGNNPITGQMAYSPSQHKMNERFYYGGADVTAMATCPADPWTSGAPCQDQKISAKGADPGPLLNFRVPLSLVVAGSGAVFQNARATASKPNPPGPPVNAKAVTHALPGTATVFWLGPDEHAPYGPYLDFIVEARPQNAQGAAWTRLGGLARHAAADYQLAVKLPAPVPGTAGWELRACSTTSLATTCTSPLIPTPDMTMLKQTPSTSFKGAIQTPPPSRNALTAPSSSFSTHPPVLRRGVEQETPGTEPKETAPEESQGEKQPVETTPGQ